MANELVAVRAKRMAINSSAADKVVSKTPFSRELATISFAASLGFDCFSSARAAEIPSLIEAAGREAFSSANELPEIVIIGGFNPGSRTPRRAIISRCYGAIRRRYCDNNNPADPVADAVAVVNIAMPDLQLWPLNGDGDCERFFPERGFLIRRR